MFFSKWFDSCFFSKWLHNCSFPQYGSIIIFLLSKWLHNCFLLSRWLLLSCSASWILLPLRCTTTNHHHHQHLIITTIIIKLPYLHTNHHSHHYALTFERNLQHNFPKMRGGRVKSHLEFPESLHILLAWPIPQLELDICCWNTVLVVRAFFLHFFLSMWNLFF